MLKQMSLPQYAAVLPLFASLDFNLVIRSVVESNTPAWVFADRPLSPRMALIWDRQDAILVAGNAQDMAALAAVRNLLHNHILPDARARGIPEMGLFSTQGWKEQAPMLLVGLSFQEAARTSYRFPPQGAVPLPPAPEGFTLRRIDDALLESSLDHLSDVRGWIDSFWFSQRDFLHTGFGYCVISGDAVASWCLTVFAAGASCELGLATAPEYRNRGLATLAGAACVEHGLADGKVLHWHCWADNLPSAAIADKIGFKRERQYTVYRFKTGA